MSDTAVASMLTSSMDDEEIGIAGVDGELEAMKERVKMMEEEALKLRELQATAPERQPAPAVEPEAEVNGAAAAAGVATPVSAGEPMEVDQAEVDMRSIYVGNVDYNATPSDIQNHFGMCGAINRVTIVCDKFTGHPKGYAYVEFAEPSNVQNAAALNDSLFAGRLIKVIPKRTNIPGFGRGRGRGRGGYRGGYAPRGYGYSPYRGRPRGRGIRGA